MDPRSVLTRTAPDPDAELRFGPAPHQVVDCYQPVESASAGTGPGAAPAADLILIHGGFWRHGYDRAHLRPLAAALAQRGHRVRSLDYRGTGGPRPVGWDQLSGDVTASLDAALTDLSDMSEPSDLSERSGVRDGGRDPAAPVLLVGHSAGAQLALWLTHQSVAIGRIDGAVSLGGCLDLRLAAQLNLDDGAVDALFPDPAPLRDVADPARLGRCPVPVSAIHGMDDAQVPVAVARSWWAAAGDPMRDRLITPAGVEHFAPIDPSQPVFATVTAQIDFLAATRARPRGGRDEPEQ